MNNINYLKKHAIVAMCFFILISCEKQSEKSLVKDNIVLQIDSYEVTEHEYDKNLNKFRDNYKARYITELPDDSLKQWNQKFIERSYLLADAYNLRYDTFPEVKDAVKGMASSMLTQVHGYLWKKVEGPKIDTSKTAVTSFYSKLDSKFNYEYLKFNPNLNVKSTLGGKDNISSAEDFSSAVELTSNMPGVKHDIIPVDYYPFLVSNFGINPDILYELQPGEVAGPITTTQGVFYILQKEKTSVNQLPLVKENYEQVRLSLLNKQEQEIIENNIIDTDKALKIKLYDENVSNSYNNLKTCGFWENLDTAKITAMPTGLLITYAIGEQEEKVNTRKFIKKYAQIPMKPIMESEAQFRDVLKDVARNEYLIDQAEKLGVTKEKDFLLDQKNYQNDVLLWFYDNKVLKKIQPSEFFGELDKLKSKYKIVVNKLPSSMKNRS